MTIGHGGSTATGTAAVTFGTTASITGTNLPGGNLTIQAGEGTGSGVGGDLIFKTAPAGGSGTTPGTQATRFTLTNDAKMAFFAATPVVQQSTVSDPSGGATQDAEARTAINAVIDLLQAYGLMV